MSRPAEEARLEITLHPDIERFLHERVGVGGYDSPGEVLTEALFLLWQRDGEPGESESADRRDIATSPPSEGRSSSGR